MRLQRLVVAMAALGTAAGAAAGEPRTLAGAGAAITLQVAGPAGPSETFAVHPSLVAALRETAIEETVRVADWPVAPGDRRTVELTRHDVYAPDARIVAIGADGEREVARSRLVFLWGTADGDSSRRVLLALDPDSGRLDGLGVTPDGVFEVRAAARRGEYRIALSAEPPRGADGAAGGFTCGGSVAHAEDDARPRRSPAGGATTSTLASLHTATVAVDTDNELLALKFSDSTSSAASYVASLVAGMNVIYERDLFVRLLQGHTVLRLSTAADPWTQPSCPAWPATCSTGNAGGAQLNELSSYWGSNYAAVPRALTLMLSGKQSSANSASGIAWLGGLCDGSYGYSFSQVFKYAGSTAANDAKLVAHEAGHNFNADHTHCYPTATTPIDTCFSGEGGCYSGATSCPTPFTITPLNGGPVTNVTGTLMSYCHMLSGCSASPVFHPQTVDAVGSYVDSRVGVCVFPNAGAVTPAISTVSPSTGSTGGGTTVTITGTGFASGATVSFLDATRAVAAASVTFVGSTQLAAVTPAHAAGVTDVVVGNPTKRTATKSGAFTFTPPMPARVAGTKTASGSFIPGGSIVYTITLANTGAGEQPNVAGSDELTDVLPSSLTLVSATATTGTATATPATNTVVWNGSIASGGSVTVTVQATVKPATAVGTVVSNQGTARYDGDGNGTNESSVLTDDPSQAGAANPTAFTVTAPPPGGYGFYTVSPCRLVDTRAAQGPAIDAGASRTFTVAGACGLPSDAKSLSLNVTVVPGSARGELVLHPGDVAAPGPSTIYFGAGETRANNAVVGLAANGTVAAANRATAAVHLVVDVNGYFR